MKNGSNFVLAVDKTPLFTKALRRRLGGKALVVGHDNLHSAKKIFDSEVKEIDFFVIDPKIDDSNSVADLIRYVIGEKNFKGKIICLNDEISPEERKGLHEAGCHILLPRNYLLGFLK